MKRIALLLAFAVPVTFAAAQTTPAPAKSTTAKPAVAKTGSKPAVGASATRKPGTATASGPKLPPGVPPVKGLVKSAFALRYQEISIGTGAVAESNKLYEVAYTGWLAADGKKFDSSLDHPNKEPIKFPQGRGRVIPGWDQGFEGMRIGGKRRLFIPYQLAYGVMGRPPVIPAKADLIFDIELVGVTDMPAQQMPGMPGGRPVPRPGAGTAPGAAPGTAPGSTPPAGATPGSAAPATVPKPVDPTAPTVAPNSAPPTSTPTPSTPPPTPPTAAPDKPANPAQPH